MTTELLDCKGLKCPQPVLKIALLARKIAPSTTLEVLADCPEFPHDVKKWCQKAGKVLLFCNNTGSSFTAQIQF